MKRYIILFAVLLCTSCNVSQTAIPVPTPNYHSPVISVHAFGKMDAEYHSDWMYYLGKCDEKKCEE